MSSKYTDIFEVCFVSAGLLFGIQMPPNQAVPVAQANTTISVSEDGKTVLHKDGVPSQEITVNTESDKLGNTIIVVCTYAGIGLTIIGMRAIEIWKSFRQADSETAQGKLSICEKKLNDMIKNMESQTRSMELIQKSNEQLNNTVQEQFETIAKLRAPSVVVASPGIPTEPDPQSS